MCVTYSHTASHGRDRKRAFFSDQNNFFHVGQFTEGRATRLCEQGSAHDPWEYPNLTKSQRLNSPHQYWITRKIILCKGPLLPLRKYRDKKRSDLLMPIHHTSLGTASWSCEGAFPSPQSHFRQTLSSGTKGWEIAGIIFLLNSSIHQSKPIFVVLYFWQAPYINKGKHLPAAWTHLWSALVLSLKYSKLCLGRGWILRKENKI